MKLISWQTFMIPAKVIPNVAPSVVEVTSSESVSLEFGGQKQ